MSEVVELLEKILDKLEEMDQRLSTIEDAHSTA